MKIEMYEKDMLLICIVVLASVFFACVAYVTPAVVDYLKYDSTNSHAAAMSMNRIDKAAGLHMEAMDSP